VVLQAKGKAKLQPAARPCLAGVVVVHKGLQPVRLAGPMVEAVLAEPVLAGLMARAVRAQQAWLFLNGDADEQKLPFS